MAECERQALKMQEQMHAFYTKLSKWTDQQSHDLDAMDREYTNITTNGKGKFGQ